MYIFKRIDSEVLENGIYTGSSVLSLDSTGLDHAKFIGQVITVFGKPDYVTEDYENALGFTVEAEDESGNSIYLEIYHGSGGPSVATPDNGCDYSDVIDELVKLILSSEPSDYDWKGVYEDIPVTIKMGVKNGEPYYESEIPENFDDLF